MQTGKMVSTFRKRLALLCERAKQTDGKHVKQSDEEIARGIGVSKQTVSAWRCGDRSPKQPAIEATARYFGVNIDWLMGFDVPEKNSIESKTPPEQIEERYEYAAELLTKLSPANQKIIMKLTPQNIDRLFGYAERLLEEQSSE